MVAVAFFPRHCPQCDPEPQLLEADLGDTVPVSVPVSDTEPNWEGKLDPSELDRPTGPRGTPTAPELPAVPSTCKASVRKVLSSKHPVFKDHRVFPLTGAKGKLIRPLMDVSKPGVMGLVFAK